MPEKQGEKPREKRAMREGERERAQPSIEGRGGGCIPTLSAPPSLSHSFPALECVWPYSIRLGVARSWFLRNQGWLILTRSIMRLQGWCPLSRLWSECRGCSWCGKYALIMVSIPHTLSGILSVFLSNEVLIWDSLPSSKLDLSLQGSFGATFKALWHLLPSLSLSHACQTCFLFQKGEGRDALALYGGM